MLDDIIKVNAINVTCWPKTNSLLKSKIVTHDNPDIICLTETHLCKNDGINVNGYTYYGLNRIINADRLRGSGGIGILVSDRLHNVYKVERKLEINDNVLGLLLTCKTSELTVGVYCVYLPPDNSKYGMFNEQVLNKLTIEMNKSCKIDCVIIGGDFNARIGNKNDCQLQLDNSLPSRRPLDDVVNAQGAKLLNFLNDIKGCLLNGRIMPRMMTSPLLLHIKVAQ